MNSDEDIRQEAQEQPAVSGGQDGARQETKARDAMRNVTEEDAPLSAGLTFRKILGGDFLTAEALRRQIGVIILIAFITMIYVSNRYSCQQDMVEIEQLKEKLKDAKYKALASMSELTEMCRESNVLEMLKNNEDSMLQIPTQPPYIINIPVNE